MLIVSWIAGRMCALVIYFERRTQREDIELLFMVFHYGNVMSRTSMQYYLPAQEIYISSQSH